MSDVSLLTCAVLDTAARADPALLHGHAAKPACAGKGFVYEVPGGATFCTHCFDAAVAAEYKLQGGKPPSRWTPTYHAFIANSMLRTLVLEEPPGGDDNGAYMAEERPKEQLVAALGAALDRIAPGLPPSDFLTSAP